MAGEDDDRAGRERHQQQPHRESLGIERAVRHRRDRQAEPRRDDPAAGLTCIGSDASGWGAPNAPHPLGSQAFMPLHEERFIVVVAPPGDTIAPQDVRAFVTDGRQGVNYRAGTWHAIQSVLEREGEFLVVDRGGDGNNCDEYPLSLCVHVAP